MKQIFLSIFFLSALAIGAQAQILKGAGILYFDSLVNVNANTAGAELAWSIKLKKGYRWDRTLGQWIEHPTFSAIDSTLANNGLSLSGDTVQLGGTLTKNTEVDINGKTMRFRDAAGYPDLFLNGTYGLLGSDANTYLDVGSTAGRVRIVGASDAEVSSAGDALVSATDTVVVSGQRIRLNAADTRIEQVSKNNTLNRVMMIDSTTKQIYYRDVSSIAGGGGGGSGTVTSISAGVGLTGGTITTSGTIDADTSGMLVSKSFLTNQGYTTNTGTVTGTGTTGNFAGWGGASALTDAPALYDAVKVAIQGGRALQLGTWTTAARPATPVSGMAGYNTSNGASEYYGASSWEVPVKSASATGLGTVGRIFYADANGRAAADGSLHFASSILTVSSTSAQTLGSFKGAYISGIMRATQGIWLGTTAGTSTAPWIFPYSTSVAAPDSAGQNISFYSYSSAIPHAFAVVGGPVSATSGTGGTFYLGKTFSPTSGTGAYSFLEIMTGRQVNQTGGASGITRGVYINPTITAAADYRGIEISNNAGRGIHQTGTSATNNLAGATMIGATTAPARTLHVTGEARITDLTTDTPTQIVGADADGDLGAITVGTGLALSGGNLTADNLYTANGTLTGARTVTLGSNTLTLSGTSGGLNGVNFSMTPSTNTTALQSLDGSLNNSAVSITPSRTQIVTTNVTGGTAATYGFFADSVRISPAAVPNDDAQTRLLAINSSTGRLHYVTKSTINAPSYNFAELTVSGGSTSATAGTPERPDNDTPGTANSTLVGTFTASGSTLDYTGAAGLGKVSGVISFTTSGGGDVLVSIYKEGTEIASTEVREAVNAIYTTVSIPLATTNLATNDTFEIRIEPVTGSNTITVHRQTLFVEKIY